MTVSYIEKYQCCCLLDFTAVGRKSSSHAWPILPDAAVHAVLETKLLNYFSVSCIYLSNSVGMHAHLITDTDFDAFDAPRSAVSPCICFLFEHGFTCYSSKKNHCKKKWNPK
ncbi:hypothetical protein ACJX0J_036205 [Zea mays]